jgi:hypothetical protein
MLAVNVAIVQVVNVVAVQHRFVSTPWAMSVTVLLSLCVLHRGHGASLSSEPSHPYMRSFECQSVVRCRECDQYRSPARPVAADELP